LTAYRLTDDSDDNHHKTAAYTAASDPRND
jgi:hypothetical protein